MMDTHSSLIYGAFFVIPALLSVYFLFDKNFTVSDKIVIYIVYCLYGAGLFFIMHYYENKDELVAVDIYVLENSEEDTKQDSVSTPTQSIDSIIDHSSQQQLLFEELREEDTRSI